MYDKIKKWYLMGLWSALQVHDALKKNIITAEQYNDILSSK